MIESIFAVFNLLSGMLFLGILSLAYRDKDLDREPEVKLLVVSFLLLLTASQFCTAFLLIVN